MHVVASKMGLQEEEAIEKGMLTKAIENAQKRVEGRNFSTRKYVLQYDNVMNKQREVIYDERRRVLLGEDLKDYIHSILAELIDEIIESTVVGSKYPEEWDFDYMNKNLPKICAKYVPITYQGEELENLTQEKLTEDVLSQFEALYKEKEQEIGEERMRELERMILIRVVDNKWMDHIDDMDQLKSGIGLRALGQQDPAAAYANEGFDMFELMIQSIKEDTVKACYSVTLKTDTRRKQVMSGGVDRKDTYVLNGAAIAAENRPKPEQQSVPLQSEQGNIPEAAPVPERPAKPETFRRTEEKIGRNDPCPCGSGKKYKNCCGK